MVDSSKLLEALVLVAATSTWVSLLLIVTRQWHGAYSMDSDLWSRQKMHKVPVPRVGGIAVFAGLAASVSLDGEWNRLRDDDFTLAAVSMLAAALPVFLAGLLEDLTKTVAARTRLLAAVISALLAAWLMNGWLPRLDIPGIDELMMFTPLALAVTAVCVAGVTHSINIIDGFNGLAGMVVVVIMAALGWLNWQAGDLLLVQLALAGIAATAGFLLLNYPFGRLFLGDGGAYLLGFWLAQLAVMTVARNPGVSAWQVLAICAYPVIEVLFSMYRRRVVRKTSSLLPDRLHFHTLLYRRVMCQLISRNAAQPWRRSSAVALVLAAAVACGASLSLVVGEAAAASLAIIVADVLIYLAAYTRMVRGHWCLRPDVVLGLRPERRLPHL